MPCGRSGRLRRHQNVRIHPTKSSISRGPRTQVIALQVNGRRVELDGPTALVSYLEKLGVSAQAVAVELNGVIIERSAYGDAKLNDGDVVEIVRMVGGGAW